LIIKVPCEQKAHAHIFTEDENASSKSVIKMLQAEANLASNVTLAREHAKANLDVVNGNHTFGVLPDEVAENNKRVATDVIQMHCKPQLNQNLPPPRQI